MRKITKEFGTFKANDQIDLQVKPGEIHALLGENGAGKSTLMNILSGLLEPTSGEIYMNGEKVNITSPTAANRLGIGMVHQHFMLVEAFTVTENIILGSEPTHGGILDRKKAKKEIEEVSKQYGLDVNPNAYIRDISVGMQQRVEILKTLYRGANVLIFDEPTAVLTPQEIDELMIILKELTDEGKSIILITHKLDEIKKVADRCTVIRRGQSIGTVNVKDVSSQQLADMMVGRSVSFKTEKKPAQPKEIILSIKDLVVKESRGLDAVKNLSLDVRAGEVVGIAGIDGNGQTELIQALAGLTKVENGSIHLNEKEITNRKPREITEMGVAAPNVSANVKLKTTELKAPITIIPSKPTLTTPLRSENVPPNAVKMSGVAYTNVCVMIEEIVAKSIRCLPPLDCFCLAPLQLFLQSLLLFYYQTLLLTRNELNN